MSIVGYQHRHLRLSIVGGVLLMLVGVTGMTFMGSAHGQGAAVHTTVKRETIVIIGASYAKGWPIQEIDDRRVINKGMEGDETHKMLARFDDDVIKQRPTAVLIWGFINDIFRSPRSEVEAVSERSRKNILAMIEVAKKHGIQPMLATEVTITSPAGVKNRLMRWIGKLRGKQGYYEYVNGHVRGINDWIRRLGRELGIPVLDFESVVADQSGERRTDYATDDGSHLSDAAYTALSTYVREQKNQARP